MKNRDSHHFSDTRKRKHPKIGDCPYFCEPLDAERIEAARRDAWIGRKIVLFKSTASTNDIAWEYAANPAHDGLCVLAESQTAGRGRRGRTWHTRPGDSILASVLLLDSPIPAELLTLTAAVAVAEAIQTHTGLPARIKWPNDVLLNGKKIAGILVEQKTAGKHRAFVVGIGINCNQTPDFFEQQQLNMPATSLAIETDAVDRTEFVGTFLEILQTWIKNSLNSQTVLTRWQQQSDLLGRHIIIESDNCQYKGTCRGIDPAEGLIVQLDTGTVRIFSAHQTSLIHVDSQ